MLIVWQDDLKSNEYETNNCSLSWIPDRNIGFFCNQTEDIGPVWEKKESLFSSSINYGPRYRDIYKIRGQNYNSKEFKGTSFVPEGMLSGVCWKFDKEQLALDCFQKKGWKNWENDIKQKWIISSPSRQNGDPCKSVTNSGNSHGECHSIDYTDSPYWICQEGFEGETCTENANQELEDLKKTGLDSLSEKLDLYSTWTGLPTLVDVWLEVEGLEGKLKAFMNQVVQDKTQQIIFKVTYIEVLTVSHYIIDLHGRYSFKTEISEEYFMKQMYNLFTKQSIDKFLYDLTQAMQNGYLHYEKKKIAQQTVMCSPQYQTKLQEFKKTLKMSEMIVKKSLLQYISWRRQDSQSQEEDKLHEETRNIILKSFNLDEHWGMASCSEISPNARDIFHICHHGDSFEGAVVEYNCPPNMSGNIKTATCKKHKNGTHYWDLTMSEDCPGCTPPTTRHDNTGSTELTCQYLWSPWDNNWSTCDKTCKGCPTAQCKGKQTKKRVCAGNEAVSTEKCKPSTSLRLLDSVFGTSRSTAAASAAASIKYQACNEQNCCQAQDKFQCNSGDCIKKSYVCDGDYDCPGQEDENDSNCPNTVRNGDDIALRVDHGCNPKGYLSCGTGYCQIRPCGTCRIEKFRIYGNGLSAGDPIKLRGKKAMVGFYDGHVTKWIESDGSNRWLSCDCYSYCGTKSCPGSPRNPILNGYCSWETFEIRQLQEGKVLQYNKDVKLKTHGSRACSRTEWFSGYSDYAQTTYDTGNCETWSIVKN
eukprot:GFUD01114389.1.p1 GENE.GFUD01114389.1~~GFUD01114389.1.p1  ORF type:complete len:870 (-),score=93.49 GFUD01114389.1:55-2319(-)